MKIISKLFIWISSLILIFILANISIWAYKMGSLTDYVIELNQKSRSESISDISLDDPVSIFSIFAVKDGSLGSGNIEEDLSQDEDRQEDISKTEDQNIKINTGENGEKFDPYDPEFEDEFNSFFGEDTHQENTGINIVNTGEEENTVKDQNHEVAEELIKKFNE